MNNIRSAFKVMNDEEAIPPTYQEIRCHVIFEVKMEDFCRKARFVAGGHTTDNPHVMTYGSVVSRESVRVALTLAALNDLDVMMGNIENAYLTAPITEKVWTVLGPECGEDAGKRALIVRALYVLKSTGAAFRNRLASCMDHLGWKPCFADRDLWMKEETHPDDGVRYWAYILIYVDDILCVHHDPGTSLAQIDKYFKMKPGSIMEPTFYLGAKLKKTVMPNGVVVWGMRYSKYVQAAVQNVQEYLKKNGDRKLKKKEYAPFEATYRSEIDESPVLGPEMANYAQSQIGILRWCVELGRIDIITEVSMLSIFLSMPREGHLDAVYHLFAYLSLHPNARVVFDPTYPDVDMRAFVKTDWKPMYGYVKEVIPPNAPVTRGKALELSLFVGSDHTGEHFTRRSRTGFVIYLNMAPIVWFSKRQPTVEASVFGAEFVEMNNGIETTRGLRYKLRMMGVTIDGPTYVYGDNMPVVHNTQRPGSVLKKKSNAICYHAVRESAPMGESIIGHVPSINVPSDICTKVVPGGQKRDHLIGLLLHDLVD
jgi:hypothetical protein